MHITRRRFTSLTAGLATNGLAARFLPTLHAESPEQKTGYAVIGLGRIAGHFLPGARASANSQITGLVSGHRDKADKIAAQYNVPSSSIYSYDNFDAIADNKSIHAVYVALPNSMHAEYTIRAAKAGKHVLCEKPMACSVAECESMIAACKKANVKLMIAYRCHFEPTNLSAIQIIRDGSIGQVQTIESTYGFNIRAGEWRLSKAMAGGGPLFDVGIYALNACRYLTGEEPSDISAYSSVIDRDGRFNEVEENVSWTMKFPSGIVASCATTYGGNMSGFYRVHGAKGYVEADPAFNYDGLHLRAQYGDTHTDEPTALRDPYQFAAQADHFSQCIQHNQEPKTPGEEGLRDLTYITKIYRSAGISI
jgi:predicted dehydrogenase